MKTRFLLAGVALFLTALTAQAVPAKPVKKTVRQADGTTIELTLRGDEHFRFYTDDNGTPYIIKADGQLECRTKKQISDTWTALRADRMAARQQTKARSKAPNQVGKPNGATIGKHRGLVILMQFPDMQFVTENVQEEFRNFFNEEGYSKFGMSGSVRDYFLKQSYGQLEINFDVVGPYTTTSKMSFYGQHVEKRNDANPQKMAGEAVDAAAADVNYANYDWDNDGQVDQVFIVYAGYNEAQGGDENTIWPHEWVLDKPRTFNGKTIITYACSSELKGDGVHNTGILDGIGTACHEFSHCMGLPDFYDTSTEGKNFGMGSWDIMDAGSYNGDSCTPAGYSSYERWFSGWMTPTELKDMARINDMKPLATTPEAYILYNDANKNEFYLLENRQAVDFDKGLYGHGLLVLHVDYNESVWSQNSVNTAAAHQRMTIMPADGTLSQSARSLAGDPFPGTSGQTELINYSSPTAATLYNDNVDGEKLMSKPIDNIKESSDGLISFVACRPELGIPEPDNGTEVEGQAAFTVTWPAVSGAIAYEMNVTEIGSQSTDPKEALTREYNFEGFVSKSAGFSDVSSKMYDYGLSGWQGSKLYTTPNKMRIGTSTTAGYVITPWWSVPASTELTIVMGANVVKAGETVKGKLRVAFGNQGDQKEYADDSDFEVTDDGKLIFHYTIRKTLYQIEIRPEKQMYLNYLAVYDGTWSAEQLGISNSAAARQESPRKATTVITYKTNKNSCTLENLNTRSRYVYRVRALGEENTYSRWSEEKTFQFSGAVGINDIRREAVRSDDDIYDLQGRKVGTDGNTLPKGIYIRGGKKFMK